MSNRFLGSTVVSHDLATETTLKNVEDLLNTGIVVTKTDINLVEVSGSSLTLGQKIGANSIPVVFNSDPANNLFTDTKALNGNTIDTNSGVVSTGTQRIIEASDSIVSQSSQKQKDAIFQSTVGQNFNEWNLVSITKYVLNKFDTVNNVSGITSDVAAQVGVRILGDGTAVDYTRLSRFFYPKIDGARFLYQFALSRVSGGWNDLVLRIGVNSDQGYSSFKLDRGLNTYAIETQNLTPGNIVNVPQASWTIDVMDGTGPSGITLANVDSQQIYWLMQDQYNNQQLFGFLIGGLYIPVHNEGFLVNSGFGRSNAYFNRHEIKLISGSYTGAVQLQSVSCYSNVNFIDCIGKIGFPVSKSNSSVFVLDSETNILFTMRYKDSVLRSNIQLKQMSIHSDKGVFLISIERVLNVTAITGGSSSDVESIEINVGPSSVTGDTPQVLYTQISTLIMGLNLADVLDNSFKLFGYNHDLSTQDVILFRVTELSENDTNFSSTISWVEY